jgi:hypothetical protein
MVIFESSENVITLAQSTTGALVQQELFTLPEHLSSPLILVGFVSTGVARSRKSKKDRKHNGNEKDKQ